MGEWGIVWMSSTSPFLFQACATCQGRGVGAGMVVFHGKGAAPTQPVTHRCFSVMGASIVVDACWVAGLALSGRPRGAPLMHRSLTWQSWLCTNSFHNSPASTPGTYSTATCHWGHLTPRQLFWRWSTGEMAKFGYLLQGPLDPQKIKGCCHANQWKSRRPCWCTSSFSILFPLFPSSNIIKYSVPLMACQCSEERGEGRVSFIGIYLAILQYFSSLLVFPLYWLEVGGG